MQKREDEKQISGKTEQFAQDLCRLRKNLLQSRQLKEYPCTGNQRANSENESMRMGEWKNTEVRKRRKDKISIIGRRILA